MMASATVLTLVLLSLHLLCYESLIQPSHHASATRRAILLQPLQPLDMHGSHGGHSHDHNAPLTIPNPWRAFKAAVKGVGTNWNNLKDGIERHSTPLTADYVLKNQNLADRVTFLGIIVSDLMLQLWITLLLLFLLTAFSVFLLLFYSLSFFLTAFSHCFIFSLLSFTLLFLTF
jgi:hypothetical protein